MGEEISKRNRKIIYLFDFWVVYIRFLTQCPINHARSAVMAYLNRSGKKYGTPCIEVGIALLASLEDNNAENTLDFTITTSWFERMKCPLN